MADFFASLGQAWSWLNGQAALPRDHVSRWLTRLDLYGAFLVMGARPERVEYLLDHPNEIAAAIQEANDAIARLPGDTTAHARKMTELGRGLLGSSGFGTAAGLTIMAAASAWAASEDCVAGVTQLGNRVRMREACRAMRPYLHDGMSYGTRTAQPSTEGVTGPGTDSAAGVRATIANNCYRWLLGQASDEHSESDVITTYGQIVCMERAIGAQPSREAKLETGGRYMLSLIAFGEALMRMGAAYGFRRLVERLMEGMRWRYASDGTIQWAPVGPGSPRYTGRMPGLDVLVRADARVAAVGLEAFLRTEVTLWGTYWLRGSGSVHGMLDRLREVTSIVSSEMPGYAFTFEGRPAPVSITPSQLIVARAASTPPSVQGRSFSVVLRGFACRCQEGLLNQNLSVAERDKYTSVRVRDKLWGAVCSPIPRMRLSVQSLGGFSVRRGYGGALGAISEADSSTIRSATFRQELAHAIESRIGMSTGTVAAIVTGVVVVGGLAAVALKSHFTK